MQKNVTFRVYATTFVLVPYRSGYVSLDDSFVFSIAIIVRHKSLENVRVQQKFLGVLQYSLMLFLQKLKDISSLESKNPVSQTYCAILNGISYTSCVLEEWNDDLVRWVCLDLPISGQCSIFKLLKTSENHSFSEVFGCIEMEH